MFKPTFDNQGKQRDFDDHFEVVGGSSGCSDEELVDYCGILEPIPRSVKTDLALRELSFWSRSFRHIGIHLCTSSPVPKTDFWRYVSSYGYLQVLTSFSEGHWPISFVAQVGEQQYFYSPRGEFVLFLNGLPFLVIEYSSDPPRAPERGAFQALLSIVT